MAGELAGDVNVEGGGELKGEVLDDSDGEDEGEGDEEWKLDPGVNARIRMLEEEEECEWW
jgi:hypothetical protein